MNAFEDLGLSLCFSFCHVQNRDHGIFLPSRGVMTLDTLKVVRHLDVMASDIHGFQDKFQTQSKSCVLSLPLRQVRSFRTRWNVLTRVFRDAPIEDCVKTLLSGELMGPQTELSSLIRDKDDVVLAPVAAYAHDREMGRGVWDAL